MSQQIRQSELFAGEDWTVLYRAFTQINFNSYDPPSINAALRSYIQTNYPEDYNDWIESSEFVAIIDLLSWLAGSLAFRTDVNARENFLETAQSRESVLRLARFLSYNPRRAQSARGLVKITELTTSQAVVDSFGVNLSNITVKWNDPDNPDWLEQFTLILNSTFDVTNPFGIPYKSMTLGGAATQLYRVNNVRNSSCVYDFSTAIDGDSQDFEIINLDIDETNGFTERSPNPDDSFNLVYRNDGKGNASTRTGFFMMFKQGNLQQEAYSISVPLENRVLSLSATDVNASDVWVQSIASDNTIQSDWTKVPAIFNQNITFNNIDSNIRDIFSVVTGDNDTISIRFSDGRFGTVPLGDIRIWYRTCNGLQYQVRPRDMENIQISIPYLDTNGLSQSLTVKFSLQETVSNAAASEDIDQIRKRAPQVYGSQNRMVSGEDYNVYPLSSNNAVKIKAVNRVYSGHSRFLDINDPTSTYQDVVVMSDDGIIYQQPFDQYSQVPLSSNLTADQYVTNKIQPMLSDVSIRSYFLDLLTRNTDAYGGTIDPNLNLSWIANSSNGTNSVGRLNVQDSFTDEFIATLKILLGVNTQIKFLLPDSTYQWATITSTVLTQINFDQIKTNATCITINEPIPNGAIAVKIVPPYRYTLDSRQLVHLDNMSEIAMIKNFIAQKLPFKLWYQYDAKSVLKYNSDYELAGRWLAQAPSLAAPSANSVMVLEAKYLSGLFWTFEVYQGLRYIFQSVKAVRWPTVHDKKVVDATTGLQTRDRITVVLGADKTQFDIVDNVYDPDGYPDSRMVVITPVDTDDDGVYDNPDAFQEVVGSNLAYFKKTTDTMFDSYDPSTASDYDVSYPGLMDINFTYKHYAGTQNRIDPAITNIVDIFVLGVEYDYLVRQWIANGSPISDFPEQPTALDLMTMFSDMEQFKMFSDQIVWRPVSYKYLFGSVADTNLQAQFKIIKLPNSTLSDGEIKSRVITAINNFFDVNNWDFGETFYFTELAAYIHTQLPTAISSVVIVPLASDSTFGDLFEVRCDSDELFISTAQVSDIVIIDDNSMTNLRIS